MVVIPARDEAPRIGAVLQELRRYHPDVEVFVVVNGSTDGTEGAARQAGAQVLRSAPGYARALQTGFREALRRKAPWVVQMDADGQHPAAAISALVEGLESADIVVASRFLGDPGYEMPLLRRTAIRALGRWASVWTGQRLRDVTSGMRAWRPEALAQMVHDYPQQIADANLLVRAVRRGLTLQELAVPMRDRQGGRSMHEGPDAAIFAMKMGLLVGWEGARPYGRTRKK